MARAQDDHLRKGRAVYAENCEQCHGVGARGDAVGYQDVAPDLMDSTPIEIAEAVRMGPDVMPRFGPKIIDDRNLNDLIVYVQFLQRGQYNPGGLALANLGPASEGFVAWTVGLGLLVLLARRIGSVD
jgi:ubiquinol-cytochrome c reductase cytochrome c subunit